MIRKSDNTIGLKVKIEASVGDRNSGVLHTGWATANVIQPKVHIDFLGPDNKIADPDMSFTTMVIIKKDYSHSQVVSCQKSIHKIKISFYP